MRRARLGRPARHHQVEDDQVVRVGEREPQALLAIARRIDRHALGLEPTVDEIEDPLLVVDHQDATDRSPLDLDPSAHDVNAPTSPHTVTTTSSAG